MIRAREHEPGAERHGLAEQPQLVADHVPGRAEVALLVELAVLGEVRLRDDPEHPSAVDHHGGVEQPVLGPDRGADDDHRLERRALGDDPLDPAEHAVGQRLLVEQVLDRVARQAELGEHHERGAPLGRAPRERQRALGVDRGLGDLHAWHGRREPDETMLVEGAERGSRGRRGTGSSAHERSQIAASRRRSASGAVAPARSAGSRRALLAPPSVRAVNRNIVTTST